MNSHSPHRTLRGQAFTLVELLVSTALLALIMVLLLTTVEQTQRVWRRSAQKSTQFQDARSAFESMTRRLSQATLNTYWRAHEDNITGNKADFRFRRQTELQFISAKTPRIFTATPALTNLSQPTADAYPGDAVFFTAPIGYSEEVLPQTGSTLRTYRSLDGLLSACGYFVEYGPEADRPDFIAAAKYPEKYRFRLMEMTVPSERLTVYQRPSDTRGLNDPRVFDEKGNYYVGLVDKNRVSNSSWTRPLWMKEALVRTPIPNTTAHRFKYAHVRADNVIALIVIPKLAEKDRVSGTTPDPNQLELAPNYDYDSLRILSGGTQSNLDGDSLDNTARDNLLPPIVQVTMIAVDEASMVRWGPTATNVPSWTKGLFNQCKTVDDFVRDLSGAPGTPGGLEKVLRDDPAKINYRVFSTDVVIRASKWSRDP